jgi:hypothetical protein
MNNMTERSTSMIEQLLDVQAQLLVQLEHGPKSAAWQAGYDAGMAMAAKWSDDAPAAGKETDK